MKTTTIRLPWAPPVPEGTKLPRHVEVKLEPKEGAALGAVLKGLDETGARLKNGRRVYTTADAMRWILEQYGEACEKIDKEKTHND